MRTVCSTFLLSLMCLALLACTLEPDYETSISHRTSTGFTDTLRAAEARLEAHPNDGTAWAVSALVYGNAGDFLGMGAEAGDLREEALLRAIQLSPNDPYTRAAFGLARMSTDPDEAENQLRQCIGETPDFLECHNLLGDLLRKTGRQSQAEGVYLSALRRWPNDGELLVSHAMLLQETGRVEQAGEVLRDLVDQQPGFARGFWHLATLLYETGGDLEVAKRMAVRALELDPLIWNGEYFLKLLEDAE